MPLTLKKPKVTDDPNVDDVPRHDAGKDKAKRGQNPKRRKGEDLIALTRATFAPPGKGTRIGVDLDGNTVRAVTITNGTVTAWKEYAADSPDAALRLFMDDNAKGSIQIAWGGQYVWVRSTELPPVPTSYFHVAAHNAAKSTIPAEAVASSPVLAAAALIGDDSSNAMLAAGRGDVARAIRDVVGHRIPIAPSAFLLGADGAYLALRTSGVEMMLVIDGMLADYRSLPARRLQDICAQYGVLPSELQKLAYGDNPQAAADLHQWVNDVASDVEDSLSQWRRAGFPVGNEVWAFGPGASAPGLDNRLADRSVVPRTAPLPAHVDLGVLAAHEWLTAYQALVAALAEPSGLLRFSDPTLIERSADARRKAQRRVRRIAFGATGLVVTAALAVPWQQAQMERNSAVQIREAAEREMAALAPIVALERSVTYGESALESTRESTAPVNEVVNLLLSSAPVGSRWTSLTVTPDGTGGFSVSGNITYGTPEGLAEVLRVLDALGAEGARATSLIGSESTSFSFTLPASAIARDATPSDTPEGSDSGTQPAPPADLTPDLPPPAGELNPAPTGPSAGDPPPNPDDGGVELDLDDPASTGEEQ